MKVACLDMQDFMVFEKMTLDFSPNINVISGENSTGKTAIMKVLYSTLKMIEDYNNEKKEAAPLKPEQILEKKLVNVFLCDEKNVGRLVRRKHGNKNAVISIKLKTESGESPISFDFSRFKNPGIRLQYNTEKINTDIIPVFIPPKEIISACESFGILYRKGQIKFEEPYYDLAELLEIPLSTGKNTDEQNIILKNFKKILDGDITRSKDRKFYLKSKGLGEIEMGLLSEGHKKIATLMHLILTESLGKNSVLFWDEPEANMNPKMISHICQALVELSKIGVQIFVTTHSYFVQQEISLYSEYKASKEHINVKFISLYKDENGIITQENGSDLASLDNNSVMNEFTNLYNKEQEMFYAD